MRLSSGNDVFFTFLAAALLVAVFVMAFAAVWSDWRWGGSAIITYLLFLIAAKARKP